MQPKLPHALCDECPLRDRKIAYATGPKNARLAVVGEAPGVNEAVKQRAFVGKSGQLLDRVLEDAGYSRDADVYVTNAVMCHPPGNNLDEHVDAVRCCKPRLMAELQTMQPQAILAAGATAAKVLLDDPTIKITKARGQTHTLQIGDQQVPLRLTLHPAYVMRAYGSLAEFKRDIAKPFNAAPVLDFDNPAYTVMQDVADLGLLVDTLAGRHINAVYDLETDGLNPFDTSKPILCVALAFAVDDEPLTIIVPEPMCATQLGKRLLNKLFALPTINWYAHNGKYDNLWLRTRGIEPPAAYYDTMLMHYAVDERRRTHSLKVVGREWLNAPDWDAPIKQYLPKKGRDNVDVQDEVSYASVPRDVLYKYAAIDVIVTHALIEPMQREVNKMPKGTRMLNQLVYPSVKMLEDVEHDGMLIDRDLLEQTLVDYAAEQEMLKDRLVDFAGDANFNPNSTQQLSRLLFDNLQLPVLKRTPKRAPSTDAATLEQLGEMFDVPALDTLLDFRRVGKITNTYLLPIREALDENNVVHPNILLHGTSTGRLSSSWLTWPRPNRNKYAGVIRRLVIARPSYKIVVPDYDQAELRVMTTEAREEVYRQVFASGGDPHATTTDKVWGTDWRMLANADEWRTRGKVLNFAILYLAGPRQVSMLAGVTVEEAHAIIASYYESYPAVAAYMHHIKRLVHTQGFVESWFGRRRRFELLHDLNIEDIYREACNFPIQATANDLNLLAACELRRQLAPNVFRVLLPFHDSVVSEMREDALAVNVPKIAQIMQQVPADTYTDYVPFTVDVKVGSSWGDATKWSSHA